MSGRHSKFVYPEYPLNYLEWIEILFKFLNLVCARMVSYNRASGLSPSQPVTNDIKDKTRHAVYSAGLLIPHELCRNHFFKMFEKHENAINSAVLFNKWLKTMRKSITKFMNNINENRVTKDASDKKQISNYTKQSNESEELTEQSNESKESTEQSNEFEELTEQSKESVESTEQLNKSEESLFTYSPPSPPSSDTTLSQTTVSTTHMNHGFFNKGRTRQVLETIASSGTPAGLHRDITKLPLSQQNALRRLKLSGSTFNRRPI